MQVWVSTLKGWVLECEASASNFLLFSGNHGDKSGVG